MMCKDCKNCVANVFYGAFECKATNKMIPSIQLDVERNCQFFEVSK